MNFLKCSTSILGVFGGVAFTGGVVDLAIAAQANEITVHAWYGGAAGDSNLECSGEPDEIFIISMTECYYKGSGIELDTYSCTVSSSDSGSDTADAATDSTSKPSGAAKTTRQKVPPSSPAKETPTTTTTEVTTQVDDGGAVANNISIQQQQWSIRTGCP